MALCCRAMSAVRSVGAVSTINTVPSSKDKTSTRLAFSSGACDFSGARLNAVVPVKASPSGTRQLVVKADGQEKAQGKEGTGFGLGGPGTWFGFGNFQERNVGRLAMVGFAAAIVMEVITGKGVLGQLGINPSIVRVPLLAGLAFLFIGGLLGGYVVVNNPPIVDKAPPNAGDGLPRNPLKTYDPSELDPLTTYTRGGVVDRPDGSKGREPYVSDLPPKK